MRVHPRAIAALGADLVTNDIVAIIELVKNSYDAMASRVTVSVSEDENGRFIDVLDDGSGMSPQTIQDVWAVVATPFRHDNAWGGSGANRRRASGAKGLGRLAAARLGGKLEMVTQTEADGCWQVLADWDAIGLASSLQDCSVTVEPCREPLGTPSGTRVRIRNLSSDWNDTELEDLQDNLSRLVSPFQPLHGFMLFFDAGGGAATVQVEPPRFMSHPKYRLEGSFDGSGNMAAKYTYETPDGERRVASRYLSWNQVVELSQAGEWSTQISGDPTCGPFTFEMRVWDIASHDTAEIAGKWNIERNQIRKALRAHKGLSVYRDGILVIPKSEHSRDWLGLDLRRVSKLGVRISTNQIVGNVQIGAETNPLLMDTSDRERLVNTAELSQFRAMLFAAVGVLESERTVDRRPPSVRAEATSDFFRNISADALVKDIGEAVEEGTVPPETLVMVEDFNESLAKTRDELERRFVYYSRLATIGTIAQMLIHEIRNRTAVLGRFIREVEAQLASAPESVRNLYRAAGSAVTSLDSLADTFAPLATRRFKRGKRFSNLRDQARVSISLLERDAKRLGLDFVNDLADDIEVAVDPGELDAVLVNLFSNALYWLEQSSSGSRHLRVAAAEAEKDRVSVVVSDSGPGIREDAITSVMEPGFTLKPDGIGMGLTVAAEVVHEHGGRLGVVSPGELGGATFTFDVPLTKGASSADPHRR